MKTNYWKLGLLVLVVAGMSSCVGKKKYMALQESCGVIEVNYDRVQKELEACRSKTSVMQKEIGSQEGVI
ncbi:MAG TPA: hypothetical protein VJ917_11330, partial [Saprospiraceae bacterium]|nr:hypothetical protein [Saprospiraceae bacterium]